MSEEDLQAEGVVAFARNIIIPIFGDRLTFAQAITGCNDANNKGKRHHAVKEAVTVLGASLASNAQE